MAAGMRPPSRRDPGRLYEIVLDQRPMFLMWQAWEPIPR